MQDDCVSQEDLDDAVIEDTCHCDLCGGSFVLGGAADYVIVDSPAIDPCHTKLGGQLKFPAKISLWYILIIHTPIPIPTQRKEPRWRKPNLPLMASRPTVPTVLPGPPVPPGPPVTFSW